MLPIALALMQFAPMLAGMLAGPKAQDIASHVVGIAQAVTGQSTPDAALAAIKTDPNLALQFQTKVVESQVELARIAAGAAKDELDAARGNATDINVSMQTEAKADHWPTYAWRPFIGFCFGINLILSTVLVVFVYIAQVFAVSGAEQAIVSMPQVIGALAAINGLAAPILGIASWFRGKAQANNNQLMDVRG